MFFADHEKQIYTPTGSDKMFDPLAIERELKRATNNQFARLISAWKAIDDDTGDISPEGTQQKVDLHCQAEELLAKAARAAFGLPEFPECTDGQALEWLCDYLDWIKKKEVTGSTSPDSSTSVPPTS